MNRVEKGELLVGVTAINSNLTNDVGLIEHKAIQTDYAIEALEEILDEIKIRKENVLADDYLAFNIVDSFGDCMLHLGGVVAKLEHKVVALRMTLVAVNEATRDINFFANKVLGIPTNE